MRSSIVAIGPFPPPIHGVSSAIQQLLQSHLAEKYHFFLLDTARYRQIGDEGHFRPTKAWSDMLLYAKVALILAALRAQITYLTISQTRLGMIRDAFLILLAALFRSKVVIHLHGSRFRQTYSRLSRLEKWLISLSLSKVSRAVVLSKIFVSIFDGLVAPERVRVVPNGLPDISEELHANPGVRKAGIPQVLFLSNLHPEKGFFDVLDAIHKLFRKGVEFRCVFAGEWPNDKVKQAALKHVMCYGLSECVDFYGVASGPCKLELLASSLVFVVPFAQQEGHPLSIVEALRAGLPIVTTPVGCIREMVIDGENGFLVPPSDANAIAQALEVLLEDDLVRADFGRKSRERFLRHYPEQKYLGGLDSLFEEILEEAAP